MKNKYLLLCGFLFLCQCPTLFSQNSTNRDSIIHAGREIIQSIPYCALVTTDKAGQPQIRTMNPFPLSDGFVIWFATARNSSKVQEIKNNPKVLVYYADLQKTIGYATISGNAEVIDNKELLVKMKRGYWDNIPGWQDMFVLIKVVPQKLEVINYMHQIVNDPKTLKAPEIYFTE